MLTPIKKSLQNEDFSYGNSKNVAFFTLKIETSTVRKMLNRTEPNRKPSWTEPKTEPRTEKFPYKFLILVKKLANRTEPKTEEKNRTVDISTQKWKY